MRLSLNFKHNLIYNYIVYISYVTLVRPVRGPCSSCGMNTIVISYPDLRTDISYRHPYALQATTRETGMLFCSLTHIARIKRARNTRHNTEQGNKSINKEEISHKVAKRMGGPNELHCARTQREIGLR